MSWRIEVGPCLRFRAQGFLGLASLNLGATGQVFRVMFAWGLHFQENSGPGLETMKPKPWEAPQRRKSSLCAQTPVETLSRHHASEWRYFTMLIRNPLKTPIRHAPWRLGASRMPSKYCPGFLSGGSMLRRDFCPGPRLRNSRLRNPRPNNPRCWPWHWRCAMVGSKGFR